MSRNFSGGIPVFVCNMLQCLLASAALGVVPLATVHYKHGSLIASVGTSNTLSTRHAQVRRSLHTAINYLLLVEPAHNQQTKEIHANDNTLHFGSNYTSNLQQKKGSPC